MNKELIEECYKKSIELMEANSSEYGFLASAKQKKAIERNYLSVFSRDASICLLGALASKNKRLIRTAKNSIAILAKNQAQNGQIPNYVKPKDERIDFWRLGCIDATLWWLVSIKIYDKYSSNKKKLSLKYRKNIEKACFWLSCQEHPNKGLLNQGEASDWADIMPRSGNVLYSNCLWIYVKKIYKLKNLNLSKEIFSSVFYPFNKNTNHFKRDIKKTALEIKRASKIKNYFLSYVGYLYWGKEADVYANALAIIFEVEKKDFNKRIIEQIESFRKNKLAIPALFNPIEENSREWRRYMESHKQNFPGQYHNGGIWPFVSCFWSVALFKSGYKERAWEELSRVAEINKKNNWQFNEWFYASNGRAGGMKYQTWNAAMFVVAYHYLKKDFEF